MTADDGHNTATRGRGTSTANVLRDGISAGEVGVWHWDPRTDELIWSGSMDAIHRLPPGQFDNTLQGFARLIHVDDRDRAIASLRKALSEGERCIVQYRLPPGPVGVIRWIEARGRVIKDARGRALRLVGTCQDITAHKSAEAELALRARQQEGVAQLGERALAGAGLDEIFAEATRMVADLAEADFAEILELSQRRDTLVLRSCYGWTGDLIGQSAGTSEPDTQIGATLRSRASVVVTDFSTEERFGYPLRLAEHGVQSGGSVTIAGSEGTPFGVLAVYCKRVRCISATDLRFLQSVANALGSAIRAAQDQERKELLIGELRHRVGNLFSLVQALHRQTGQSARDAQELEMKFGARLAALASAHAIILEGGWQRASLRSLLKATLAPFIERVTFTGTDVRLPADAAFSFSMALHELATNATKYGALSHQHGKLSLQSNTVPDALGEKLVLVWKEEDGPPPPESTDAQGFGSRLISQVVERQLGGAVTRAAEPDGMRITMEFPIA